jgi:hypothetical protein
MTTAAPLRSRASSPITTLFSPLLGLALFGCAADKPIDAEDSAAADGVPADGAADGSADGAADGTTDGSADGADTGLEGCAANRMSADAALDGRLGPAGDPATWGPLPPEAVVATTYLPLQGTEASMAAFDGAMGPIIGELMAPAEGLLGLSFLSSAACGDVRTLTVWADEAAMMGFVVGPAHAAAMARTSDISRGGEQTDHWRVDALPEVGWAEVIAALPGAAAR